MAFDQQAYWEQRLSQHFDLAGVGYLNLGLAYNRWLYRAKVRALDKARRRHAIQVAGRRVLDVGCATGFWVKYYERAGASQVVGIDVADVSVDTLKTRYPEHTFLRLSIGARPFDLGQTFDILNVWEVMWYLTDEEFNQAFENLRQIASPGAWLLVTDLLGKCSWKESRDRERLRAMPQYQQQCAKNGFNILGVYPLYFAMNTAVDIGALNSPLGRILAGGLWKVTKRMVMRYHFLGWPWGAVLYHVDGFLLQHFADSPIGTKLLILQRR